MLRTSSSAAASCDLRALGLRTNRIGSSVIRPRSAESYRFVLIGIASSHHLMQVSISHIPNMMKLPKCTVMGSPTNQAHHTSSVVMLQNVLTMDVLLRVFFWTMQM